MASVQSVFSTTWMLLTALLYLRQFLVAAAMASARVERLARTLARTYSRTLGGRFYLDTFGLPGHGRQSAVCVITLDSDSPLHAAGVRPGDIITRLDNIRVTSLGRLERHYCWTTIRYFRGHGGNPYDRRKTCYNRRFHIRSRHCNCR